LRKYKGYLFLNYQQSDSTWSVKTLKLEKGELEFNKLIHHYPIDSLVDITDIMIKLDTVRLPHHYCA